MKATNQKPVELNPLYTSSITGTFKPDSYLKQTTDQLLNSPINPQHPVSIADNGRNLSDTDVAQCILDCLGDVYDAKAQNRAKDLCSQTMVYFNKSTPLNIDELFLIQASCKNPTLLPIPNAVTAYTPGVDVIPAARKFLAGQVPWEIWFGSLGFYARPRTLGFSFATQSSFEDFKTWFNQQLTPLAGTIPAETQQLIQDFQTLTLTDLTESLKLRDDSSQGNDPVSFPRVLISYLMMYASQVSQTECSIMPFCLSELYCPESVVFINVERHSKANATEIEKEWKIINQSINQKIPMVSNSKLNKLTAVQRSLQRAANMAAANMMTTTQMAAMKAAKTGFRKSEPTAYDLAKLMKRIMDKMANVARSENTYKVSRATYQKPNRRDPDNFNLMGKSTSTKYRPDIHLYIDTSGSISESNYASTMKACILMAKKLNVNLYFNTFSDYLSQTTMLNVKDKSLNEIYKRFRDTPKVTGGTDFEPIWHFINRSPKRKREISVLITDFGYYPPNHYAEHPKNLYYVPCANMNWHSIVHYAENFVDSMQHIDPLIRNHLLF